MLKKRAGNFSRQKKFFFWFFLSFYAVLGLAFVFLGKFWTDESWYFGSSWLVASGELPYRDFFIHHNPVFYYVYALPQALFGPDFIVGRLTSLLIMVLSFGLVWRLARKLGGLTAALISGGLLITNLFTTYYFTSYSYRVLEAFFMIVFFTIQFSNLKDSVKYPLAVAILSLVVGIRFPIDIVSGLLGLYLGYIVYRNWQRKRVIILSFSAAALSLAVVMLPFIILSPDQFFFATVNFSFMTPSFWVEAGIIDAPGILDRLYHIVLVQSQVFLNFTAVSAFLIGLLFYVIAKKRVAKGTLRELIGNNQALVLLIGFVVICELLWTIPAHSSVGLRTLTFLAAVIVAGVGLARVLADIKDKSATLLLYGLIIGLIILTPFAQYAQGNEARPTLTWQKTEVKYVNDVANKVAGYTDEGDRVLTFTPVFVWQAGRELMPGTTMELFNFFPTWGTERARKHNLLNSTMLLNYLTSREPEAVVLTEGRFFSGEAMGRALDKYRPEIMGALEENYYLVEKLSYPAEIGRGDVYIYLPKD